jgi:hypothetical protein
MVTMHKHSQARGCDVPEKRIIAWTAELLRLKNDYKCVSTYASMTPHLLP